MATPEQQQQLVALTTMMFNAPPGATFLAEFEGYLDQGLSIEQVAINLSNTDAFNAQFDEMVTDKEKIDLVLSAAGIDESSAAYNEAYSFFEESLANGVSPGAAIQDAAEFLSTTEDEAFAQAAATFNNKVEVGVYHSVTLGLGGTDISGLKQVVANITQDPATVTQKIDQLTAQADGGEEEGGTGGSIGPTFSVTEDAGTLQFDGTATGAITFTLTADTVTAERQGVTSELTTTTANLKGANLPADTDVKVESGTLTLTAAQANSRAIGGESAGSVIVTALAETADADLSNITVDTTLPVAENDDFAFTGELNTDADITVEMNGDNSVDLSNVTANVVIALSSSIVFEGSFASDETVNVSGEHELDISALAVADLPEGGFTLATSARMRLTAEQANGQTISGDGEMVITELADNQGPFNLDGVSVDTTLELAEGDDLVLNNAFSANANANLTLSAAAGEATLDINSVTAIVPDYDATTAIAEYSVESGVTLMLADSQADARPIDGAGDVSVSMFGGSNDTDLSNVTASLTLVPASAVVFDGSFASGETVTVNGDYELDITALAIDDLPGAFDLDGTNLIVTAEQAEALTVTGASSVTVKDLDDTPDADLTGIDADLPLTLDLGKTDTVDFKGQLDTADLTVMGDNVTLNVTGAAAFTAENVAVDGTAALVIDGSQIGDINNVAGSGIFDLRGDVQADEFIAAQLAGFAEAGGFAKLADADSLQGSFPDVKEVESNTRTLRDSDIAITVTPAVSLADAKALTYIETGGEVNFSVQDALGTLMTTAMKDNAADKKGLAEADAITLEGLEAGNEAVAFDHLTENSAATTISFLDGKAILTQAELFKITGSNLADQFDLALTADEEITVTGVAADDVLDVDSELSSAADTIVVADEQTVSMTAAELDGLNATLAATTPGVSTSATLTVTGVANTETLTATDLVDTFDVTGLTDGQSATIDGMAVGDAIDTGITFGENLSWSFSGDTLVYEIADGGTADVTVVLTGVDSLNETNGEITITALDT